jgi:hypothetical protein
LGFVFTRNDSSATIGVVEYRDPTGHVKETPEQEAMEEGAVGRVSDIMTGKTEAGQRTTIDKNTPSIDLTQSGSARN